MKRQLPLSLLLLLLLQLLGGAVAQEVIGSVAVQVQSQRITGEVVSSISVDDNSTSVFHRFRRVPYALPPVGERRFARPVPWNFSASGDINATAQAPMCPQATTDVYYSEDCLFMNIWTPNATAVAGQYPVLVFIHGGRFETGGIASPEMQGETLLRYHNVVFVTINYRLGATGFLFLDNNKLPGNFGLLDQRLALQTLQRVIGNFGGDANRMTLAGHGTGAASVGFHVVSQSVNVTQVAMLGGSPLMPLVWSNDVNEVRRVSERFANVQMNCARGGDDKLDEVIQCLRNKTIGEIITNQREYERIFNTLEFMPVLDREFFNLQDPQDEWQTRRETVSILMGVSEDSGSEFVQYSMNKRNLTVESLNRTVYYEILDTQFQYYPRFPSQLDDTGRKFMHLSLTEWNQDKNKQKLKEMWSRAVGDFNFLCPVLTAMVPSNRLPNPKEQLNTYLYLFDAKDHLTEAQPGHQSDMMYFLGAPAGQGIPYPPEHTDLSKQMMADLVAFVESGDPNSNWDKVVADNWNYNRYSLTDDSSLYNQTGGFAFGRCFWWGSILPYVNGLNEPRSVNKAMESAASGLFSNMAQNTFSMDSVSAAASAAAASTAAAAEPASSTVFGSEQVTVGSATIVGNKMRSPSGEDYSRFLGIPYAMPPTGTRRFSKPQPSALTGSVNATSMRSACPQRGSQLLTDEDCLYMNIWSPMNRSSAAMPVFVYLHGGFFDGGSATELQGDTLAAMRDAVVVSFNYRLGVMGFLSFPMIDHLGNFGLWDQELALKWVVQNVRQFNGDPAAITVVGSDAGSISIGYHLIRQEVNVSKAIMMTGAPSQAYPLSDDLDASRRTADQFMELLGCNGTAAEKLQCMQSKSSLEIMRMYNATISRALAPFPMATIDSDFFKKDPWASVRAGEVMKIPLIVGLTSQPGIQIAKSQQANGAVDLNSISVQQMISLLAGASALNPRIPKELSQTGTALIGLQYYPLTDARSRQSIVDSFSQGLSDRFFICGVNDFLKQTVESRQPLEEGMYHYLFTEQSVTDKVTSSGASLFEDAKYFFGEPFLRNGSYSDSQRNLSQTMMDLFLQFAKTGNPNSRGDLDVWAEYDRTIKPYLHLSSDSALNSVNFGHRVNECAFWRQVLPYVNSLLTIRPPDPSTRPPIGPQGEIIGEIEINIDFSATKAEQQRRSRLVGDIVRLPNGKNITRFLGVPYANKTQRYAVSQMVNSLDVVAKTMPPACPQFMHPRTLNMSEDCLFVNIWAPVPSAVRHPVAIFFHGGNYTSGANSFPEFRGEQLLENEDVVLVTVNYRLGNLGFLYLDDDKLPGNFGLLDQQLAIQFVKRVIRNFGGNPDQITVMGHGTDAASAGFHAVNDPNNLLFQGVVMMGGSPSMPLAWSDSKDQMRVLGERYVNNQLDCARGELDAVIQCIRALPLERVMQEQFNLQRSRDHLVFQPVVNKAFFNDRHPYELWKSGSMKKPLAIGVASDSGRYYTDQSLARRNLTWEMLNRTLYESIIEKQFRYYPRFSSEMKPTGTNFLKLSLTDWNYFDYNKRIKAIWSQAMGDFNFLCPVWEATSDLLRANNPNVYVYYTDVEDPFRKVPDQKGADHYGDLHYLFGEPFRRSGYPTSHQSLSKTMMKDLVTFLSASTSDRWRATNISTSEYMYYDIDVSNIADGDGTVVAKMMPDGFGLNTGRCPMWKNELPFVNNLTAASTNTRNLDYLKNVRGNEKSGNSFATDLDKIIESFNITIPGFGKLIGQTIETHNGTRMSEFLGVPFAKPPVNELRFAKPVKPDTTGASVHDVRKMPPMCIQKRYYNLPQEEDCLYLNIWTPLHRGQNPQNLPVIVFISGGFFEVGGVTEPRWIGSNFLDYHNAIVVTINYRLGAFGFLSLDDTTRGNFGLYDQEMALQWVKDNIAYFGGDPAKITAMGVEAGSVSIGYHLARTSKDLFKQAVMMTGSPYMSYPLTDQTNTLRQQHAFFVQSLGCRDASQRLQCLRRLTDRTINEAQQIFQQLFQGIEFQPVIDGEFIPSDPWKLDPRQLRHVPMIYGGVDRPGNFLIERIVGDSILTPENFTHDTFLDTLQYMNNIFPRYPTKMTDSGQKSLRLHFMQYNNQSNFKNDIRDIGLALSDRFFTCANNKFLDLYSNASSQPVYHYVFTEGPDSPEHGLPLEKASLFDDAFYAFGNPASAGVPYPNKQTQLSQTFMQLIFSFAENGNPNRPRPDLLEWYPYEMWNKTHLGLDADTLPPPSLPDGFRRQECGFWDHTLPYVNSLNEPTPPPTTTEVLTTAQSSETQSPSTMRTITTRPPIGPRTVDGGFVALVTITPIVGVALLAGAAFLIYKFYFAKNVVTPSPEDGAAPGGETPRPVSARSEGVRDEVDNQAFDAGDDSPPGGEALPEASNEAPTEANAEASADAVEAPEAAEASADAAEAPEAAEASADAAEAPEAAEYGEGAPQAQESPEGAAREASTDL